MTGRRSHVFVLMMAALFVLIAGAGSTRAQEAHPAQPASASQPQAEPAAGHGEAAAEHGESIVATVARLFNFALLAATLVYFLRSPLATYLATRSTEVRAQLVKAGEMRATAAAEAAEVDKRQQALPAELDAMRKTGAEEVKAEEARIRQAAEAERVRLLEVTKREIGTQVKIAERDLMKRASDLAVKVAADRIKATITDADQLRLVDRYLGQVGSGTHAGVR